MAALRPLSLTVWRMVSIERQRSSLSGEGARRFGGRWNPIGQPALYLATEPATAAAEFYQGIIKPGTLVPYTLEADRIAELTAGDEDVERALNADWKTEARIDGTAPPSWSLAADLIAAGAEGALVPSVQNPGGTNLVLWRWRDAGEPGEGAALTPLDPDADLSGPAP